MAQATLDFFKEIQRIQKETLESFNPQPELRTDSIKIHLEQGVPLLNFVEIPANKKLFQSLSGWLCDFVAQARPEQKAACTGIKKFLLNPDLDYQDLLEKIVWQQAESIAEVTLANNLAPELFSFVIINVAKPFFQKTAAYLQGSLIQEQWQRPFCPVCGWGPLLDKFTPPENKRFLICSFCETEWLYPRLKCAFCENIDHQTLAYFKVEGDEGHQVTYCKKCRGYLKTTDLGKTIKNSTPILEDLQTIYLDVLAMEENLLKDPLGIDKKTVDN